MRAYVVDVSVCMCVCVCVCVCVRFCVFVSWHSTTYNAQLRYAVLVLGVVYMYGLCANESSFIIHVAFKCVRAYRNSDEPAAAPEES
jgi:Na+(H+)/acetate symporter ActP